MDKYINIKKNITPKDYLLFAEAWYSLAIARFIIIFFSFKRIVTFLKKERGNTFTQTNTSSDILFKISLSINRACYRSFWRTKCFEQALAARIMLRRRKTESTIYFGVAKSNIEKKTLRAHAWLECCGQNITGGKNNQDFTIIHSFKS